MAKYPPIGMRWQAAIGAQLLPVPVDFVSVLNRRDQQGKILCSRRVGIVDRDPQPIPCEAGVTGMALLPPWLIDADGLPIRIIQRRIGPLLVVAQMKPPALVERDRTGAWILHFQSLGDARGSQGKSCQDQSQNGIHSQSTGTRTYFNHSQAPHRSDLQRC